ncbi:alanine racemase [Nitrincola tapanii]|uniref:Alanine racemase n=1 Tax=Nitrincola tapanii TaxID=1708751 RepID=A0A5A9W0C5_9GAMM|nr:alanine racemase [Nitrincola tapanii]KAA0874197.1 alanine racemase [Nitrincola tapanii]
MARQLRAQINLQAIASNYALAKAQAPAAAALAVVKADAYGHGAVAVAQALSQADAFAVAAIEEALELREAGITQPILLLEGFFEADELALIQSHRLWSALHHPAQLQVLMSFLERSDAQAGWHIWLKVDSGMHRLGFMPEQVPEVLNTLQRHPKIAQVVLMSHFACADEPSPDKTLVQLQQMQKLMQCLPKSQALPISLSNSAAVMAWPQAHHQWLRPGLMLYGASPFAQPQPLAAALKPAMTLTTPIIALREVEAGETVGYGANFTATRRSRIATLAVGYADGYPRHAPNGTPVALLGHRASLAGRVSMDMITVDLTDLPQAQIGDEVELWGAQVAVEEVARLSGTIPYTLLSGLTRRVKRVYSVP